MMNGYGVIKMKYLKENVKICNDNSGVKENSGRRFIASDIYVPEGYRIELFASGLNAPISMVFTEEGDLLIAESGILTDDPRILRLSSSGYDIIASDFIAPIHGLCYRDRTMYVSQRGYITSVKPDGTYVHLLSGLPSNGDYCNNQVTFGPDGKLYYG
ncbi:MAG: repeat containing protein [Herbinix sp.]|jgi:glucose/arabinose dehydrogenase|nr:repeat containing protein [Herbinix sp.]